MFRSIRVLVLAALACTASPPPVQAAPVDDARAALVGQWIIQVGRENRQRLLVIEDVRQAADGALSARGRYNYIDAEPGPVDITVKPQGTGFAFGFQTTGKAVYAAHTTEADKFGGTLNFTNGNSSPIEGLLESREVPKPGAAVHPLPAQAKITMLFVTAWDCYYCAQWIKNELPKWKKEASFAAEPFRRISCPIPAIVPCLDADGEESFRLVD